MTAVERVKAILKERHIAVSKLEKDLGFANGYIGQLKKGTFPADRLDSIARYLNVTPQYLMYGTETMKDVFEFRQKNREEEEKPVQNEADELVETLQLLRDRPDLRAMLHAGARTKPETVKKVTELFELMEEG